MAYQTINPSTEELVKTFKEHTDAQLEAIIGKLKRHMRTTGGWAYRVAT